MDSKQIVIIGAGILGLATAHDLLQHGYKVLVLEQDTIGHAKAGSHGSSRLLRYEYGADALYPTMVDRSLYYWKYLEKQTGQNLYQSTGVLVLGTEDDNSTQESYTTLKELGYPINYLTRAQCQERFPQFNLEGYTLFTYNENAGMLHASHCLETLRENILAQGGMVQEKCKVVRIDNEKHDKPIRLLLADHTEIETDQLIVTAGPWVHHLLGNLPGGDHLPVRLTQQYVLYFDDLPEKNFAAPTFPAFMVGELYGFPLDPWGSGGKHWLKTADHQFGSETEADERGPIDMQQVEQTRETLAHIIPALRQATLISVDSCIYDVSADEDFIIDRLPTDERIIFATGMSGHAFKFGLVLGEMLGSLVRETEASIPMDRFRLARFHPDHTAKN